jgi:MFS family permease
VTVAALVVAGTGLQPWTFWAAMATLGAATGMQGPAIATYSVDHAPGGRFGPAMGLLRFAGDVGFVLGPLALGAAVDLSGIGYSGAILLNAAILALFGVLFMIWGRRAPAEPEAVPKDGPSPGP